MASILCSGALAIGAPLAHSVEDTNIILPATAGALNVRDALFGAKGDGKTDDTAAIQKALSQGMATGRIVYVPNGSYLLSETLRWRDPAQTANSSEGWGAWTTLQGQSRAKTILKLKSNAPGFSDPDAPRALIQTGSTATDGQKHYSNGEGNEAFMNFVRNLTVDVGDGNTGAVGVDYQVSNVGALRHVSIKAGANSGYCGINLSRRDNGPGLIKDVSVEGFAFGARMNQEIAHITLEDVLFSGQRDCAIWNRDGILAARHVVSRNTVPAMRLSGVSLTALFDSDFSGGAAGNAIECSGSEPRLFLRNLRTQGYSGSVKSRGEVEAKKTLVEWSSDIPLGPGAKSGQLSLRLPIRDTPEFYDSDQKNWADVGAPSGRDDTRAVQAALRSGETTVFFQPGRYSLSHTVVVPGNVRRVVGFKTNVDALLPFDDEPLFRFSGGKSSDLTILENLVVSAKGGLLSEHLDARALVLRDIIPFDTLVYRNSKRGSGPLFIEDVSSAGYTFNGPTQVWARQFNIEGGAKPKMRNNGAQVWALGWKSEGGETLAENHGGALELWGGLFYTFGTDPQTPMIVNDGGSLATSFVGANYTGGANGFFNVLVREGATDFSREKAFERGNAASVPLYLSLNPAVKIARAPIETAPNNSLPTQVPADGAPP